MGESATRSIAAVLLGLALGSGGCRQLNESHCGNQQGDLTCEQRDATAPFCDRCVAVNDGCVSERPMALGCGFGEASTGAGTSTTAGDEAASVSSTDDAADSSSTGEPSLCGNGVIDVDAGEVCDGELLPAGAPDCDTMGYGSGPPRCEDDCSRLNYMMCPGYVEECGNEEVGAREQCDGTVFGGGMDSCDDFPNLTGPGLVCTDDCTYDTTGCMICRESGQSCAEGDTCCNAPNETCAAISKKCCVANLGLCT